MFLPSAARPPQSRRMVPTTAAAVSDSAPVLVSSRVARTVACSLAVATALVTVLVFFPALRADWVDWDDQTNFLDNPHYRGLQWSRLQWMLTTNLMGHWIPVTWLTLGMDYVVWGMNPFGYHLTNLLWHTASAVLFYLVTRRLLGLTMPSASSVVRSAGAAAATLFFAIHPLRVESVAWITERRALTPGFFLLLAVLSVLKPHEPTPAPPRSPVRFRPPARRAFLPETPRTATGGARRMAPGRARIHRARPRLEGHRHGPAARAGDPRRLPAAPARSGLSRLAELSRQVGVAREDPVRPARGGRSRHRVQCPAQHRVLDPGDARDSAGDRRLQRVVSRVADLRALEPQSGPPATPLGGP